MIRIGTSGYSYDDWVGPFYPPGTPKSAFLRHYAARFDTVEINMTYYRIPSPSLVASWVRRAPASFDFVVKANKAITHERDAQTNAAAFAEFRRALAPLHESGRLAGVLLQFPNSFKPEASASDYLLLVRERLADVPLICEFRHSRWATDDTFDLLQSLDMGYCCVDEPRLEGLMPDTAIRTAPVAYVRFHGRNAGKWYQHDHAYERYNYLYSRGELAEWVERVARIDQGAFATYVFFNNHYGAQAVANAEMFAGLLSEAGLSVTRARTDGDTQGVLLP